MRIGGASLGGGQLCSVWQLHSIQRRLLALARRAFLLQRAATPLRPMAKAAFPWMATGFLRESESFTEMAVRQSQLLKKVREDSAGVPNYSVVEQDEYVVVLCW